MNKMTKAKIKMKMKSTEILTKGLNFVGEIVIPEIRYYQS